MNKKFYILFMILVGIPTLNTPAGKEEEISAEINLQLDKKVILLQHTGIPYPAEKGQQRILFADVSELCYARNIVIHHRQCRGLFKMSIPKGCR